MIDVVFTESAHGSLSVAKSYSNDSCIGGCTSIFILKEDGSEPTAEELRQAQRDYEEKSRKRRENMIPLEAGEVFGFSFGLSYGDLNDRIGALKVLYSFWDENLEAETNKSLERAETDLTIIREKIAEGETLRVWYSDTPDEMCGFYWFMQQLRDIENANILTVKLPDHEVCNEQEIVSYNGWGDVAPEEWGRFAKYAKPLHPNLRRKITNDWVNLERQNAPLRTVLNGKLCSVGADIYDSFIYNEIAKQPVEFREAAVVGNVLGRCQLGISDGLVHNRIDVMIAKGELIPVTQSDAGHPGYWRILRKKERK